MGYRLHDRIVFHGLDISVENVRGSVRRGTDKDGHPWSTVMHWDYGYVRRTEGVDGDHVDCYIGPDIHARKAYIVRQNDPTTGEYDEDKVMLGFSTARDAVESYLMQYDRPGFYGGLDAVSLEDFKRMLETGQGVKLKTRPMVEDETDLSGVVRV